jgi:Rrf2 family cysteine metabolism transcriptional repressor
MVGPGTISEKCRYGLRAIFDLALRDASKPVKIQEIASSQDIPQRFLEIILAELKHGGFVDSKRGADGGYILLRPANQLTVGEVIAFMQGSNRKKESLATSGYIAGDYVFARMWQKVNKAVTDIYDGTTFASLVEQELAARGSFAGNYII